MPESKTRLHIKQLRSVGLVDAGANAGAHLLISKRADEPDPTPATTVVVNNPPDDSSLLRKLVGFLLGRDVEKKPNVGELAESMIHRDFTMFADSWFGDGVLSRDERIALSNSIGAALDSFRETLEERAPALYERAIWQEPEDEAVTMSKAADTIDDETATAASRKKENPMPETPTLNDEIRAALPEEAQKYLSSVETRLAEATTKNEPPSNEPPDPSDLAKRDDLPEDVRKALEASAERIAAAEKREAENAEKIAKLEAAEKRKAAEDDAGRFSLVAKAEEFAPILVKVRDALDETENEKLDEILASANARIESAKIFDELGSGGRASDAETEAKTRAKKLAETEGVSYEIAYKRVVDADPELRKRIAADFVSTDGGR